MIRPIIILTIPSPTDTIWIVGYSVSVYETISRRCKSSTVPVTRPSALERPGKIREEVIILVPTDLRGSTNERLHPHGTIVWNSIKEVPSRTASAFSDALLIRNHAISIISLIAVIHWDVAVEIRVDRLRRSVVSRETAESWGSEVSGRWHAWVRGVRAFPCVSADCRIVRNAIV